MEEDFSILPLEEKLSHKSWKARLQSYEELGRKFRVADSPKDSIFWDYFESIKKCPIEANVVAQEAALSCVIAFLECCDESISKRLRPEITNSIIEKGLSSPRSTTKAKAMELIIILVEIDIAEPVVTDLVSFLAHKQPKLVAAVVNCLFEIVRCFGANVAGAKSILKHVPSIFSHPDKSVRTEGSNLVIELHRWLGSAVLSLLSGIKPVQLKELQELCAQVQSTCPTPTRYLRSQKPMNAKLEFCDGKFVDDAQTAESVGVKPEKSTFIAKSNLIDPYDLVEALDLNTVIPSNLFDSLASSSWKERKEALENLLPLVKVPKIVASHNYSELLDALCKRVSDVNILVVIHAAGCIEAIANGLRSNFGPYRNISISALLEKAKEKKQSVLDGIRSALDSLRYCVPHLNDGFLEEVSSFIAHKNPSVRAETLLWISRLMQSNNITISKKDCKSLIGATISSMDDGTTEVRESASLCLACVYNILGESAAAPLLDSLDKIKLNKVKDLSSKVNSAQNSDPNKPTQSTTLSHKSASAAPLPVPLPVSQNNRKTPAESQLISHSSSKISRIEPESTSTPTPLSFSFNDADAERFFTEWLGELLCSELSDSIWKNRLAATEQIFVKLDEASELPEGFNTELFARFVSHKPGWKDSNFQVIGKVISCLLRISKFQFYTRESASIVISGLVEKLSDPKLRQDCGELFMIFAEHISIGFVVSQVVKLTQNQKSPKIQADIVKWLQCAIQAFGIASIQISELIEFCKTCLGNSNLTVRTVAISLAGTLRVFVGSDIRLLFNEISPGIISLLDSEFSRVSNEPTPHPSRQSLSLQISAVHKSEAAIASSTTIIEDLIPRINITSQITDVLITKINDQSWKLRKEGLDEFAQILSSSNNRVKYTGSDLFSALKGRLSDSNKNISLQALDLCGAFAEAVGTPFEKHVKHLVPSVFITLSDNKIQVRQAALRALDRFLLVSPLNAFISSIGPALCPDSPNTRKELLTWSAAALSRQPQGSVNKDDLLDVVGPVVGCLQDRSGDVRKSAQAMVNAMSEHVSVDSIRKACSDQQPKLLPTLMPLLEAVRKNAPVNNSVNSQISSASVQTSQTSQANPRTPQRASSVRQPRPSTPIKFSASLHDVSEDQTRPLEEFPILSSDVSLKSARAEKDKGSARWAFDSPRKDIVDFLREQMIGNMSYTLIGKLFSDDFKDTISAMNRLEEFIRVASDDDTKSKFMANIDLILKYITLRFFETNTSVLIKALELSEVIVSFLDNCNYRLSEYEANSFIPFLITKMGDGKESLRIKIHGIFRQMCRIFPASKIFIFLIEGLKSKNSRTRVECLDGLAHLLARNGLSVINTSKHLHLIATMISDRDSQVRNSALNVLAQANQLMGNATLQKHLLGIPAKDLDTLEERLKRIASGVKETISHEEDVEMVDAPLPESIEEVILEPVQVASSTNFCDFDYANSSLNLPTPVLSSIRRSFEPSLLSHPLDQAIDQIQFSTDLVCIHALQLLESHLNQLSTEINEELKSRVNALIHSLIVRLKEATSITYNIPDINQMKSRLCRYVTNSLVLITSNASFCQELDCDIIELLISETLIALISDKIPLFEDYEQLERALNILIVKVLEGVPQNRSYCALLNILKEAFRIPPNSGEKFPELVMKCIWKLTKQLPALLNIPEKLNVQELLLNIHNFLSVLPPIEWKMRNNEGLAFQDLPLRTVKTILHEIVQFSDLKVLGMLSLVPETSESFVFSYIKAMLRARGHSEQEINKYFIPVASNFEMEVDSGHRNVMEMSVDIEVQSESGTSSEWSKDQIDCFLKEVCSQICSKPDTRLGLQQLYEFRSSHPYAIDQVNQFLSGLGDFFHKYISRSLERIDCEQAQAAALRRSAISSNDSGNSVEMYKQKLIQLRQQIFGSDYDHPSNSFSGLSENHAPSSPSALRRANSHLESPKMRSIRINGPGTPTKLSTAMDLASVSNAQSNAVSSIPGSPSSILSLKERLARLRGESSQLSQQ